MDQLDLLPEFVASQTADIDIGLFIFNLLLAALLSYLLGRAYVRFGSTLSNREMFSRNFLIITMTTITTTIMMIIITTITITQNTPMPNTRMDLKAHAKPKPDRRFLFA